MPHASRCALQGVLLMRRPATRLECLRRRDSHEEACNAPGHRKKRCLHASQASYMQQYAVVIRG